MWSQTRSSSRTVSGSVSSAKLLLKDFPRLRTTDLGRATENVLTMVYSLPEQKYDSTEKMIAFHEQVLDAWSRCLA